MAKNENRQPVEVRCTVCKNYGRKLEKNKKNTPDKIEISKFCKYCGKHTTFKEK